MADANQLSEKGAELVLSRFSAWNEILQIMPPPRAESIPDAVQRLADQREEARKEKNFALSDELRRQIYALGFVLEDTPKGMASKGDKVEDEEP